MRTGIKIILLFSVLSTLSLSAQQDPQFTQFMYNKVFYNPAYSGVEALTRFSAIYRQQWLNYTPTFDIGGRAPETFMVMGDLPVPRVPGGVSVMAVRDRLGNANNIEFQLAGAYHLGFSKSKLSLGARFGVMSRSFDAALYRVIDESDPIYQDIINGGQESQVRPDISVGAHYQSEKLSIGISALHLVETQFDFGVADLRNALNTHLYGYGTYRYEASYNVTLLPSVLLKSDLNTFNFDIGAVAEINANKIEYAVGLTYRESDAVALILGMNLLKEKSLRIGYAFDYVAFGQEAKEPTSHELMVTYVLPPPESGGKIIQRTPRFRL